MQTTRCAECHATIPVPEDFNVRVMKCQYCGNTQAVPNLVEREQLRLAQQQAEFAAMQQAAEFEHAVVRDHLDRKERKASIRWGRVTTIFSMLLAPVIISVVVFDLPARLGFGAAGEDRVQQTQQLLAQRGCTVAHGPTSLYASGAVSKIVNVPNGCLRVVAAGGPDHGSLTLKIYDADGKVRAKAESSADPQVEECVSAAAALRYEVQPGPASKGRLTHLAMLCPAKGAEADAEGKAPSKGDKTGPAERAPTKRK